jgi:hypothetical protein
MATAGLRARPIDQEKAKNRHGPNTESQVILRRSEPGETIRATL